MDTAEALARLDALENEAAALRRIIEAPEPVEKKPLVQARNATGFAVKWDGVEYYAGSIGHYANSFKTFIQAKAYAEAFNTLLDLRRQPGSEVAEDGKQQWHIKGNGQPFWQYSRDSKISEICPCFDSRESAEAARDTVGLERILRMYNTLHGRGH